MVERIIEKIDDELVDTFRKVDDWFDIDEDLQNFNPANGGWNIKKILEHISLTNHFLLILIKKGTKKALDLSLRKDFFDLLNEYELDWDRLNIIGRHNSFVWIRPLHMEPKGTVGLAEIRNNLNKQLDDCRGCLAQLKDGQGILYKTTMTVNRLGKIDVYHYIYFLAQHAKRHLEQMEKIRNEFK